MKLLRYGIELETMTVEHLEMVRLWRNQDYIREKMQFRELLSSRDQQKWFRNLDPEFNLYWIIRYNSYPIGLVNLKDIDLEKAHGEAGVFIGEPSYLEMPQAMLAILFMMELAFLAFGFDTLRAKIHHRNHRAIRFNLDLGYTLISDQPKGFQYYSVNHSQFENATRELRRRSIKLYGSRTAFESMDDGNRWTDRLNALSMEAAAYFSAS